MRRREFLLSAAAAPALNAAAAPLRVEKAEHALRILAGSIELTAFHFDPKWDKPFFWPLRTPSGVNLARGFPVEPAGGDSKDHTWHRGLFFGHGDINGFDYWREIPAKKTCRIELASPPKAKAGSGRVVVEAEMNLQRPDGPPIGSLRGRWAVWTAGAATYIDSTLTWAGKPGPLKFGDTDDGGVALRLTEVFRQDRGATLLNDLGARGTENLWGKPAKWIDYSSTLEGKPYGAAILEHPANHGFPNRWHARPYGLLAANPWALASFTKDKTKDGSYTVPAGASYTLRHRIVIHEGDAAAAKIAALAEAYAKEK